MIPGIIATSVGLAYVPPPPALIDLDFVIEVYSVNETITDLSSILSGDVNVIPLGGLQFNMLDTWTPCTFTEEMMDLINATGVLTISMDFEPTDDNHTPIHMRTDMTETYGSLALEFYPYFHSNLVDVILNANGDDTTLIDFPTTMTSTERQQFSATLGTDNPGVAFGLDWTAQTGQYWGTAAPPVYQWETITLGGLPDFPNPIFTGTIKRIRIWTQTLDVWNVIPT